MSLILAYEWQRDGERIESQQWISYILSEDDIGHSVTCIVYDSTLETSGYKIAKVDGFDKVGKAALNYTSEELEAKWKSEPCSEEGATDGKIYNLSENVEYATKPDFSDRKLCSDAKPEDWITTDDGIALTGFAAGTYYIRYFETDTCEASETAVVVVEEPKKEVTWGDTEIIIFKYVLYEPYQEIEVPRFGDTLYAYIATSDGSYSIPGLSAQYQWMRGDEIIEGATSDKYTIKREDIGYIISCVVSDASGTITGSICGGTKAKADKAYCSTTAEELAKWWTSEPCSKKGASDGIINTMSENVEIATKPDFSDSFRPSYKEGNWTYTDRGASWSNFKEGTYYLRIAETDCYYAGDTVVVVVEDGPEEQKTQEELVSDFVKRFYTIILERDRVNEEEIEYYTSRLMSHEIDGCSVARGFVMSPEYENKGESDLTFVNKMYLAFFNREADAAQYYCDILALGYSREVVLAGFVNSPEFKNLCAEYGIEPGELIVNSEDNNQEDNQENNQGDNEENNQGSNEEENQGNSEENNQGDNQENNSDNQGDITKLNLDSSNVDPEKLDSYVKGLYTQILGRDYDEGGLEYWMENIMSGETYDAATAARVGFFESPEYQEKNKNNTESVIDCYHAFLGRDPEPEGLAYWVEKLDSGEYSRQKVIDLGFGHSNEFKGILANCGFRIIE